MMRAIQLTVAYVAVLVAAAGQAEAGVMITYRDVGPNLQFDFSGSLNVDAFPTFSNAYVAAAVQQGKSPVFYSATSSFGYAGTDFSVTHTLGSFATNLPGYSSLSQGTSSGTAFMFRLNDGIPGPATSVDVWGDWGAANSPINGQLILTGQSSAGIGMVDGWNLQSQWGTITFQAADVAPVPEPSSLALFGIGACFAGFGTARRRRRETP